MIIHGFLSYAAGPGFPRCASTPRSSPVPWARRRSVWAAGRVVWCFGVLFLVGKWREYGGNMMGKWWEHGGKMKVKWWNNHESIINNWWYMEIREGEKMWCSCEEDFWRVLQWIDCRKSVGLHGSWPVGIIAWHLFSTNRRTQYVFDTAGQEFVANCEIQICWKPRRCCSTNHIVGANDVT